jgi:hypothetical protein
MQAATDRDLRFAEDPGGAAGVETGDDAQAHYCGLVPAEPGQQGGPQGQRTSCRSCRTRSADAAGTSYCWKDRETPQVSGARQVTPARARAAGEMVLGAAGDLPPHGRPRTARRFRRGWSSDDGKRAHPAARRTARSAP